MEQEKKRRRPKMYFPTIDEEEAEDAEEDRVLLEV